MRPLIFLSYSLGRFLGRIRTGGARQTAPPPSRVPHRPERCHRPLREGGTTPGLAIPATPPAVSRPYVAPGHVPSDSAETLRGAVWVIDGDSIIIKKRELRLYGIDAPEIDHPFGKQAKWALLKLCKGQEIRADLMCQDHFDRTVARCFLPDGRDLSAEMVKLGLAIDWAKFSGGRYRPYEVADARKRLWLADARQNGRMHVWHAYEARLGRGRLSS